MTEDTKILDFNKLKQNEATRLAKETTDVDVIIALSKHHNGIVRKNSLVQMCPCRVKKDIDKFWARVFEMVYDEDPIVRAQVKIFTLLSINYFKGVILTFGSFKIGFAYNM